MRRASTLDVSTKWPRCERCHFRHGDQARCPASALWLVAGTPYGGPWPYPCRCGLGGKACHRVWCPCAGRVDLQHVPAGCCGHRVRPHHVAAALRRGEW